MPRTIEQLQENRQHMTREERVLYTLANMRQPASARQISEAVTTQRGIGVDAVAKFLNRNDEIGRTKDKYYDSYKYYVKDESE